MLHVSICESLCLAIQIFVRPNFFVCFDIGLVIKFESNELDKFFWSWTIAAEWSMYVGLNQGG